MSRRPISAGLRFEILERDGFACRYCGAPAPEVRLHVDHRTPVIKGGTNDPSNLVTACETCNLGKHARELLPFIPNQLGEAISARAAISAMVEHGDQVSRDDVLRLLLFCKEGGSADRSHDVLDIVLNAGTWDDVKRELRDLETGRHRSRVN